MDAISPNEFRTAGQFLPAHNVKPLTNKYICRMIRRVTLTFSFLILILLGAAGPAIGQMRTIRGAIRDIHSDEPVPFATVSFAHSQFIKLADSSGTFTFHLTHWPSDTIQVTYVGFETKKVWIDTSQREMDITIQMIRGKAPGEVVVKGKINRGLLLWKKIVRNKPRNDRSKFANFSYELYNKLEMDLNKVNKEKWQKGFLPPKPFKFILNNVDTTSEANPILPLYLTETISDYYFQRSPKKTHEVIRGNKTIGVENESFSRFLGGMYQNTNVYNNFIPVFDRSFVSPISDNGDAYYNYKVPDTQFISGQRYFHFVFYPKRKGELTFQGDAWIADSSFAVQKMNLMLSPGANVNFIEKLSLVQEYQLVQDSIWFLSKDKFVADFMVLGKNTLNFIGRKTTTYKNVVLNDNSVTAHLANEKLKESVTMADSAMKQTDAYWSENRHETLNQNEKAIYHMVDTLLNMPAFQKMTKWLQFIGTGYGEIGNFEIGPWYNWASYSTYEGPRVRFDLGTNPGFHKKLFLTGYLAYGFRDHGLKGKAEALYVFNKKPRSSIHLLYKNDIDWGQTYYDEVGYDNIFAVAFRKNGVPVKLLRIQQAQAEYFKEWMNGFSVNLGVNRRVFNPILNLPGKEYFPVTNGGEVFNDFETTIRIRFAYQEKYVDGYYYRYSLGSDYPIAELRLVQGIPGIFNSSYRYTKVNFGVSDYLSIPPYGSLSYAAYAGKVYGTLPYMLLSIAPGNEIYYFNKYAFNLMNRYEFVSDRYAGFNIEHNIGNGIFKLLPFNRFLKLRQFWNAKVLWGDLSTANKDYNFHDPHPFTSLDGKTYIEVGTGVDNILRFLRLDLVWRLSPTPLPQERYKRFGIFGSFRISF
jgi:hypothetical protein